MQTKRRTKVNIPFLCFALILHHPKMTNSTLLASLQRHFDVFCDLLVYRTVCNLFIFINCSLCNLHTYALCHGTGGYVAFALSEYRALAMMVVTSSTRC